MTDDERDPFGRLDEAAEDREGDPFETLEGEDSPSEPDESDFEEVSEPSVGPAAGATPDDELFAEESPDIAEVDIGDADEADVWEALSAAQARGSVAEVRDRTYAEVSKHSYCETCRHFSEPPAASCTNDGTEILEFVDMETVRVVDCPVVAERRQLERED